jgi:small subunit ribosomal protein S8
MDPISDMLTRIKNAQAVRSERLTVPFSNVKFTIAQLLQQSGYLTSVERVKRKAKKAELEYLDLELKYDGTQGAISGMRIVSRPSRHIYARATDLKPIRSGYGMAVVSTSKGIMSSVQARKDRLGGEVMFEIW